MINAKNSRNLMKQEILFIAINCIEINAINFLHLSQFFTFIILCQKYSRYAKNGRNLIWEQLKMQKCKKFCDMINPIYCD